MDLNLNLLSVPGIKQKNISLLDITIIYPINEGKHGSVVLKHPPAIFSEIIVWRLEKLFKAMLHGPAFKC